MTGDLVVMLILVALLGLFLFLFLMLRRTILAFKEGTKEVEK